MKNFSLQNIFTLSLLILVVFLMIRSCTNTPEVGQSQIIVENVVEENVGLTQEVKDSLALVPLYAHRIDSMQKLLTVNRRAYLKLNKKHEKLISDIDSYTVTDDIQFFSDYLSSRKDDFRTGADTDNAGAAEAHQ